MALTRTTHWATQEFHKFLMEYARKPFAWGTNDCALFAANGIEAITGIDIAADFRDKYTTAAGAISTIKEITGGTTVEDAAVYVANKHCLVEWTHPLMAKRGDLVVYQEGDNEIAGLVHLSGRHLVSPGENGLRRTPITSVKRAWHVG